MGQIHCLSVCLEEEKLLRSSGVASSSSSSRRVFVKSARSRVSTRQCQLSLMQRKRKRGRRATERRQEHEEWEKEGGDTEKIFCCLCTCMLLSVVPFTSVVSVASLAIVVFHEVISHQRDAYKPIRGMGSAQNCQCLVSLEQTSFCAHKTILLLVPGWLPNRAIWNVYACSLFVSLFSVRCGQKRDLITIRTWHVYDLLTPLLYCLSLGSRRRSR